MCCLSDILILVWRIKFPLAPIPSSWFFLPFPLLSPSLSFPSLHSSPLPLFSPPLPLPFPSSPFTPLPFPSSPFTSPSFPPLSQLIWKFVASEEDYVSQLTMLNEEFRQQCEIAACSRKPPITLEQSNAIFRNR